MDATESEAAGTHPSTVTNEALLNMSNVHRLILGYVATRSPEYCQLRDLRQQGWENPVGDDFFKHQRQQADNPTQTSARIFYKMTIDIGRTLDNRTNAFDVLQTSKEPLALDMGMAPGGFSTTILGKYPEARVRAITLPDTDGGHAIQLRHKNLKLELRDINTLAGDLGLDTIPETGHEARSLTTEKLFAREAYDVAICGGQITRNQQREQWREQRESRRLQLAQLVIAMEHLKNTGTLIAVLHKPESLDTAEILHIFSSFSDIMLFKPVKAHAKRSSFYMVAKNVQPHSLAAVEAVETWKEEWRVATLGSDDEYAISTHRTVEETQRMLEQYGEELVALGRPIWAIQARALKEAPFIRSTGLGRRYVSRVPERGEVDAL